MRFSFLLAASLLAAPVAACSVKPLTLATPTHAAISNFSQRPPGGAREVVLVTPFKDDRAITLRCGMKKNRFGGDTADVSCAEPPNVWLAQLLRAELLKAGYRVTAPGDSAGPAAIKIEGELRTFFSEPKLGFFSAVPETDVEVLLRASNAAGLQAERRFYWKGVGAKKDDELDARIRASMEDAVRQAIAGMVDAIAQLLDQYARTARAPAETPTRMSTRVATGTVTR